MPKYKVRIRDSRTRVAYVEIEADNEDEATDEAYEIEEKDLDWEYTHTEYFVDDVEEVKEDGDQDL